MKEKILALALMLSIVIPSMGQDKADTIFYDKDWKGVPSREFAAFCRVVTIPADSNYRPMVRDYYLTGELRRQSQFLSVDRYDDAKTIFDGQCITYFKSANVEQNTMWQGGKPNGESTIYFENGLVKSHANYKNGVLDGIYSEFSNNGQDCTQVEYINGNNRYDYYVVSNNDGCSTKYSLKDHKPLLESPNSDDRKTEYVDGKSWESYLKNGVYIGACNVAVKDYGKYYRILVEVRNQSMVPMDFDPGRITATYLTNQGKVMPLHVYAAAEYADKVRREQNWEMFVNDTQQIGEATAAGYRSSVTKTDAVQQGQTVKSSVGYVASTNGSAVGALSTATSGTAASSSVSVTESYDAAVAYQAQMIAKKNIANFNAELAQQRKLKEDEYLKHTTIRPGDTLSGYVNVQFKKGAKLIINVDVNSIAYEFVWELAK